MGGGQGGHKETPESNTGPQKLEFQNFYIQTSPLRSHYTLFPPHSVLSLMLKCPLASLSLPGSLTCYTLST